MGILDDAIREHLELKRQHGAGSDDLERLEKEAFGAPARPGDPEFADPEADAASAVEEADATSEPDAAAEPEADRGGTSDWLAGEDETTVAPVDSASAERARIEHPQLDDTADHPAPEPEVEAEGEPEPEAAAEPEAESTFAEPGPPEPSAEAPPEAPERSIFDAEEIDLDEFDLELDDEPSADSGEPPAAPREVRRDPVVEDDTGEAPAPVEPRKAEGDGGDEKEEDDPLAGTPDFLQDAPEGEDLWFEQGPPKDFDFDDED